MSAPLILGTNSIKDVGYNVDNSLRFNQPDNPYLTRTISSAGSATTVSISFWFKRGKLADDLHVFSSRDSGVSASSVGEIKITSGDILRVEGYSGSGYNYRKLTNRVFRDVSAWYHILVVFDTSNATADDRIRIYINGVRETSFSTSVNPSSSFSTYWFDTTDPFVIGTDVRTLTGASNLDGYLSEVVVVDGTALNTTDVGEFDEDSGIWKPIDVSGLTFGTNGFYLDFENSGSLGADVSGNGNNFTVNNLTSVDQSTDTCTNNAPTMNILSSSTTPIFSQGNLEIQCNNLNSWNKVAPATFVLHSGKWYWEIKNLDSTYPNYINPAFMNANYYSNSISGSGFPGNVYDSNNGFWNGLQGGGDNVNYSIYRAGSSGSTISSAFLVNHIMSFALDLDNRKCWLAHNGSYVLSGNPSTGVNETWGTSDIDADTPYVPAVAYYYNSSKIGFNFGSPSQSISSGNSDANGYGNFEYAVPTGFYAINSKNLAEYG